ncbi:MAG: class I SAM-dependent methyltransferase [Archangium sp.]|nr:class I SAM-dependent methyltransferase [Archangium sp.]MDP3573216.1 class I SAM-dependent methyltransferase [Archangium sp.]
MKKKAAAPAKKKKAASTRAKKKQAAVSKGKAFKLSDQARREAMLRRVSWRTRAEGKLTFPAVPGLVDHYVDVLSTMFKALGRPFAKGGVEGCRAILAEKIDWAFSRSHNAWIEVEWKSSSYPPMSVSYTVTGWQKSIEDAYAEWVKVREPPLFGKNPDAVVVELAKTLGPPGEVTVLDAGAGTGRNALPLARAGYVVDALELAPALVAQTEKAALETQTDLRSVCGSYYDRALKLPRERYRMVVLAELCSHWRGQKDLRNVLERLSELVEPGGVGVFNMFLALDGYRPTDAEREFSQIGWCPLYTRADLAQACAGLPLKLVDDVSGAEYEKAHGPQGDWPPTGWFERWASGSEVFDLPPGQSQFEMRWLTFKRT